MARWLPILVGGIATALFLRFASYPVPGWAVGAFVCVLLLAAIPHTVMRLRAERRLMRTLWKALTGK